MSSGRGGHALAVELPIDTVGLPTLAWRNITHTSVTLRSTQAHLGRSYEQRTVTTNKASRTTPTSTKRNAADKAVADGEARFQKLVGRADRLATVGTLAAGVAHELNNPLASMRLAAERGLELSSGEAAACFQDVLRDTERCARINRNLLRFALGETLEPEPSDVNEIVGGAVELTYQYALHNEAAIHLDLADTLPTASLSRIAIQQVVINLLRNAVEAGSARIAVETRAVDDAVEIVVSDTGRGMTPAELRAAFDPFQSSRVGSGGTGLGLSLSQAIVVSHGGTLGAGSEPGRGATVTVRLPTGAAPTETRA